MSYFNDYFEEPASPSSVLDSPEERQQQQQPVQSGLPQMSDEEFAQSMWGFQSDPDFWVQTAVESMATQVLALSDEEQEVGVEDGYDVQEEADASSEQSDAMTDMSTPDFMQMLIRAAVNVPMVYMSSEDEDEGIDVSSDPPAPSPAPDDEDEGIDVSHTHMQGLDMYDSSTSLIMDMTAPYPMQMLPAPTIDAMNLMSQEDEGVDVSSDPPAPVPAPDDEDEGIDVSYSSMDGQLLDYEAPLIFTDPFVEADFSILDGMGPDGAIDVDWQQLLVQEVHEDEQQATYPSLLTGAGEAEQLGLDAGQEFAIPAWILSNVASFDMQGVDVFLTDEQDPFSI